ncbi:MAG: hypothetical protein LBV34_13110, partial [Nocardiopsaceae bacterium]|nr:hypothetical protein [Nocardiopsaceae bacterium]
MMQPLVVRPSGRKQLSFLFRAGALLVFGAIAVWALVLVVAGSYAVLGWSILALLLLLALSQLVRQRVDQLFVDGDTFGNVTTLGRRRTFSRASLTRVDRVTLVNPQARPEAFLVFVGPDGRALFRTPDLLWSDHDLAPLWDRLGKAPSPDRMLTNAAYGVAYLHLRPWSATD